MKNILLTTGLLFLSFHLYSQSQNWKVTGNSITTGDYLGTSNNEPLIFKANDNEGLRIKPNGELRVKNFDDNLYTGLVFVNTNGVLSKLNFTGNANQVLFGNGTFGSVSTLTGWTLGTNLTTGYNVGIGTSITPEKLTVDGNILANGSINGTSLNVIDIVTSGKEFKISTSLCMKGIDVNDPLSRNEICGMNGDLYIQSENANYNTIINKGNGGKVGIGVIPDEAFHVGVNAKFESNLKFSNLSTNANANEILVIDATGNVSRSGDMQPIATSVYNVGCKTDSNGDIYPFWKNGPYKIYTGGNPNCDDNIKVGINIANPTSSLHVVGDGHITGTLRVGANSILLGGVPQSGNNSIYSTSGDLLIQSDPSNSFNTILNANNNGNVGIGIATPGYKLEVAGTVRACKFIAEANSWCDFVFADNYQLKNLSDVESYLKKERHLEYLPSEEEIYKNGVDVVQVYTGLLRHTEENTLYIIQLEKEKDELKKRVEELEKEKVQNDIWKKEIEKKLLELEK